MTSGYKVINILVGVILENLHFCSRESSDWCSIGSSWYCGCGPVCIEADQQGWRFSGHAATLVRKSLVEDVTRVAYSDWVSGSHGA